MRPQSRADLQCGKRKGVRETERPSLRCETKATCRGLLRDSYAKWRKSQNSDPESNAATGNVNTHAAAMLRSVDICRPLRLAAMVPATPELSTWVVLTGKPKLSAAEIVAIATSSAQAPCA